MNRSHNTLPSLLPLIAEIEKLKQVVRNVPVYGDSYAVRMMKVEQYILQDDDSVEVIRVKDEIRNLLYELDAHGLMPDL